MQWGAVPGSVVWVGWAADVWRVVSCSAGLLQLWNTDRKAAKGNRWKTDVDINSVFRLEMTVASG